MLVIVGGPSGCGKSTAAQALAHKLHLNYLEGDALHPKANIEKMARRIPLTDEDRWGWLEKVARKGVEKAESSPRHLAIATCSALTLRYRNFLRAKAGDEPVVFVFLPVEEDVLYKRVLNRKGHFMKADMVKSQLDLMEVPRDSEPNCLIYWNTIDLDGCTDLLLKLEKEAEDHSGELDHPTRIMRARSLPSSPSLGSKCPLPPQSPTLQNSAKEAPILASH